MRMFFLYPVTGLFLLFITACGGRAAAPRTAGSGDILRIASWNIENFVRSSPGPDREEKERKRKAIVRIITEDLDCPDIIALQEVMDDSGIRDDGTTAGRENFTALARDLSRISGYSYGYASLPPADGRDGGRRGANIRTGFLYNRDRVRAEGPAERWTDAAFDSCRKPLASSFSFRGRSILAVNVHLTSRLGGERSARIRLAQAEYISSRIGEILDEDKRALILLTGDFNDEPRSPPLNALTLGRRGLSSLTEGPTYSYRGTPCQLDHMLSSPALTARRRQSGILSLCGDSYFPSDHRPIMAVFALGGSEEKGDD